MIFVSNEICRENFDDLTGLVYPETLVKVKQGFKQLSPTEKRSIQINENNLFRTILGHHDIKKNEDTWVYINTKSLVLCNPKGLPKTPQEYLEFINGPNSEQNILNASYADYT